MLYEGIEGAVDMAIRALRNGNEWPYWYELAVMLGMVAAYKIVQSRLWSRGWVESVSSIIDMRREDLGNYLSKVQLATMRMANSAPEMMSIMGSWDGEVDLMNDGTLAAQINILIPYLCDGDGEEHLPNTAGERAWLRIAKYLSSSEAFKALMGFYAANHGGMSAKDRMQKYGLIGRENSSGFLAISASFKEAYPNAFQKGFWKSLFG